MASQDDMPNVQPAEDGVAIVARLTLLEEQFAQPQPIEETLRDVFDFGNPDFTPALAIQIFEDLQIQAVSFHVHAEATDNMELRSRVNNIIKRIEFLYSILIDLNSFQNSNSVFSLTTEQAILRFTADPNAKEVAIQTVYKFVLANCRRLNVRHRGDVVYTEVYSENGVRTQAWCPATDVAGHDISSMETLVAFICTKLNNPGIWTNWITGTFRFIFYLSDSLLIIFCFLFVQ